MTELTQQMLDEKLLPDYLTPEQRDAISADGGSLLVSASAGSGKTFVLSSRVVYMLSHRNRDIWADGLLVVTFTRAAAGEMKKRISAMLSELVASFPEDEKLRRQQQLFPKAKITTIDAFCNSLLKEHFDAAGLAPDFGIADDVLSGQMSDQILEGIFERHYADKDEEFAKLSSYFSPKSDAALRNIILKLYHTIRTYPFPLHVLEENQTRYESSKGFAQTIWGREILSHAREAIIYAKDMYRSGQSSLAGDEITYSTLKQHHSDVFDALGLLHEQLNQPDWDSCRSALNGFKFPRKPNTKKIEGFKKHLLDYEEKYYLKTARDMVNNIKKDYFSYSEEDIQEDIREQLPYIRKLFSLVREFYQSLHDYKWEKNRLDFLDVEHAALNLLVTGQGDGTNRTVLGQEISKQISMILVDEVQDINHLNDMLFMALSKDGSNLFMVGDVKQSIYSFRQASPELFVERRESYSPFSSGEYPASIMLSENFRSRPEVTNCVNYIFSQIMSKQLGGLDYSGSEMLKSAAVYPDNPESLAEFHIIDLSESEGDKSKQEIEAEYIAGLIQRMYASGFLVKGEDGSMRPCRLSDFVILMRSLKGKAEIYTQKLLEQGLDAWTESTSGYFQSREVSLVINFLKIIDNPLQDIPALSVMLSPMFDFTVDDLAQIRTVDRKLPIYSCVQQSAESMEICRNFIERLSELRNAAALLGIEKLIQKIYDEFLVYALLGTGESGKQKLANLRLLLHHASSYKNSHGKGLAGFIRYIESAERSGKGFESANIFTENSSAVRIMSIHKSKGLEFPICIIANCSGRINTKDFNDSICINNKMGITMKHSQTELLKQYPTMPYLAAVLAGKQMQYSEELRILYVAMTRAKEKLIMISRCDSPQVFAYAAAARAGISDTISPMSVFRSSSFSDWLAMALIRHKNMEGLREIANCEINVVSCSQHTDTQVKLAISHPIQQVLQEIEPDIPAQPDPQALQALINNLSYNYPYLDSSLVPAKLSVTQIAKQQQSFELTRPDFRKDKGLNATERGTATHEFIQFADFDRAAEVLEKEISRLVESQYITQVQADNLNREGLRKLFKSPLVKRMTSAVKCYREINFFYEIDSNVLFPEYNAVETVLVQGIADCVIEEEDGIVIVDYKTDRADEQQLVERYRQQLLLYAEALEQMFKKPARECILYSIYLGKQIEIPLTTYN